MLLIVLGVNARDMGALVTRHNHIPGEISPSVFLPVSTPQP